MRRIVPPVMHDMSKSARIQWSRARVAAAAVLLLLIASGLCGLAAFGQGDTGLEPPDTGLVPPPDTGLVPPDTGLVPPDTGLTPPGVAPTAPPTEKKSKVPAEVRTAVCIACHVNTELPKMSLEDKVKARFIVAGPEELAEPRPPDYDQRIVMSKDRYEHSAHGAHDCVECHTAIESIPHNQYVPDVGCEPCHEQEQKDWEEGEHALAFQAQDADAPDCNRCHGNYHYLLASTDPRAVIYQLNIPDLCGDCHGDAGVLERHPDLKQDAVPTYWQDIHGQGIREAGLVSSAACSDCHHEHRNLQIDDLRSSMSPVLSVGTCGTCHITVATTYTASIHGKELFAGNGEAPGCNACHPGHNIMQVVTADYQLRIAEDCGECHNKDERGEDRLDTYRETYHGKAEKHGSLAAATCSDCHEYHFLHDAASTQATIHPTNIVQTCVPCHPYSNEKWVAFLPHLHFDDKSHPQTYYPWLFMTILLIGTMGFFVLHSLLWLIREIAEIPRRKRLAANGGGVVAAHYQRFNLVHRLTHTILFISVIGLAATGLPLRYPEARWSHWLFQGLGGVGVAGVLHRIFAALTILYVGIHFVYLWNVWRRAPKRPFWKTVFGPTSLIPNWDDVKQFFQHLRWMLFLGPHPRFGRWTYWDKFDYWAVFWGVAIIGASGAVMAFSPQIAPFVPGWVFNIALIIHSDEALLAASFLFAIHFFHVHLRPLKFPMDHVMFSGTMTQEEMEEERPLELERLQETGQLEAQRVEPPSATQLVVNRVVAAIALAIGLVLLVGLIWSELIVRFLGE